MRNTIVRSLCVVLAGLAAAPGVADAQSSAYTNSPAELFAGPAPDYPVVAQIPPGTALDVFGCLSDYTWCDVALPGVRGWIDAQLLDYPYQGSYVPLLEYGAIIGVPVTGFAIGAYWDRYYRHRPWYPDRDRWAHRAEPRLGPGGMPPAQGRPQPGAPMQVAPGGPPPVHDTRPSATRGGWNGANRVPPPAAPTPAPTPMPGGMGNARPASPAAPTPMPGGAGNARPANPPPAVLHPSPAPGGEGRTMPQPARQGGWGGGGYARPQGGGNGGGNHGGGGGGGPDELRH
ncbi:SH3 domain-containing protein [Burkholderia cenocepacia]|uniref:SH3 domain-containing protein n=1 Tax=Burkholderia cenocepacia TaxID=95486 RepID=UPI00073A90CC|nr:SH3 domain-containing protein [Burkholderia cenocepacia]ALV59436.1 peptide-binding protein [Burkholderia cenocepacia]AMU14012.1 peptide-binding protein [Burkholderia cenocepacia]AQQ17250.1 peptide-binding protein [Burkholderia cenocepacia]AQQ46312.1 peptide-binding protein [Burkholderia cenocepacia]ARF88028.1 putative translation initiation factor IF-2 [Burkholderia cenocepacia]